MSEKDVFTSEWLNSYGERTRSGYRIGINSFFQFLDQTFPENAPWNGDKVYENRKVTQKSEDSLVKFKYEATIVRFREWLRGRKSMYPKGSDIIVADSSAKTYCIHVRSFFAYMRMPLNLIRPEKLAIEKIESFRNIPYRLQLGDIVAMKKQADTKQKYVLLVGKSLGLRVGDFISLKQGQFEANLKESQIRLRLLRQTIPYLLR